MSILASAGVFAGAIFFACFVGVVIAAIRGKID